MLNRIANSVVNPKPQWLQPDKSDDKGMPWHLEPASPSKIWHYIVCIGSEVCSQSVQNWKDFWPKVHFSVAWNRILKSKPENVIKKLKKRLFLNIYGETELYNLFTFSLGSFKIIDIKRDIGQILTFSTWQKFERLLLTLQDRPLYNKTVLLLWFHFFLLFLLSTHSNLATLYHSTKERNVLK